MTTSDTNGEVVFGEPHPLGLPADRYSYPVRTLGSGTFGKVYLCCFRPPPQLLPQPSDGVRQMSIDMDCPSSSSDAHPGHAAGPATSMHHPQQPTPTPPHQTYQPPPEWVAVKISKPLVQCDLRSLEYLKRESVNQCRLQHPHVIGFREVGITTDMRLYLALEFADSGTLKQWLARHGGRLPEASARWFAQQLVYGLAYCHAHGVYNRDIKPENLLLHCNWLEQPQQPLREPLLKVADFGLCKSSSDSVPNSCVGSPHYMAPEVFTGKEYDGCKADVFSCGVVLYQMVFGALPFSRTPDGRKLDFQRNFKEILDNMRRELWPQLLPPSPTPAPNQQHQDQHHDQHQHQPTPAAAAAATAAMTTTTTTTTTATATAASRETGAGAAPAPPSGEAVEAAAAAAAGPSPGLMDLLLGMLRYDPAQRLSLYDVKRHPWYREGLTEECYAVLLSGDGEAAAATTTTGADEGSGGGGGGRERQGQAGGQSVELIEAEFARIIAHCAALQRQAAAHLVEAEDYLGA